MHERKHGTLRSGRSGKSRSGSVGVTNSEGPR
jgi:hypothetical protein